MKADVFWISSLEKVFADEDRPFRLQSSGSALLGESYHMQMAIRTHEALDESRFRIEITSDLKEYISSYIVRGVPVMLAAGADSDDDFLRKTPGLYPDLLEPSNLNMCITPEQWRGLYFEVDIPTNIEPQIYPITVSLFTVKTNECIAEETFYLEVIGAVLPKQTLLYTCWFHNDCLSIYYNVPVFSEEYWKIVGNYMENAAKYGQNMILTPIFTPALNTAIGHERPTVQLVEIKHNCDVWDFDFSNLIRYVKLALSVGIDHFEIAHLCTQWGAWFTPKIMVEENGKLIQKFGWNTASVSDEYISFLYAFLPRFKDVMRDLGVLDNCYFHISDEPNIKQIENYSEFCNKVAPLLSDCKVFDALFDYEYYRQGIIKIPIPSNDNIEQFIENGLGEHWTYYCCGQLNKVSNRMMSMPSYRTRIIGLQFYKFKLDGFLQWGYNFWLDSLSRKAINPYVCTDSEDCYPSGDAFIVYPGSDGKPIPSLREMVFLDALQDLRALKLLESLTSFDYVIKTLESSLENPLTFKEYPRNIDYITDIRETVNQKIKRFSFN